MEIKNREFQTPFNLIKVKQILDQALELYNNQGFVENDPVSIPHRFTKKEDIEIAAFFAAMLAWGQRGQIIRKVNLLIEHMDNEPYQFINNASANELKVIKTFVYRTFNGDDAISFIKAIRNIYMNHQGQEALFTKYYQKTGTVKNAIQNFRRVFFDVPHGSHTEKHFASPEKGSACKRFNLFLKWMVRTSENGIDFGLWKQIAVSDLICPLDVHTAATSRELGLITTSQNNWRSAEELTNNLKLISPDDPVRYDVALFCLNLIKKN